jgi:Leucine-rich repeat (LRR) protein
MPPISIENNKLCNLSESIKAWLTSIDSTWQNSQYCHFTPDSIVVVEILKANNIKNYNLDSLISQDLEGEITKLRLDNMGLTVIPDTIRALSALTNINLSNNSLSELPISITQLPSVKVLDLKNNKLTTFPDLTAGISCIRL